ncbi:MAG: TonB-dependent receptor domain-containing protein [Sphingomicrobium sp.]
MTKFTQALKCGGSALSLALVLATPAFAQTTPPAAGTPSASEKRPATAADNAPEQTTNPITAAETAAPAAAAQTNAPTDAIVITGTSIRGVAPVGSNLISVGREAIENTAVQTVQQVLKTVPAVVGLNSVGQGAFGSADAAGTNAPTIHGLGASASNSTLIIIDGHRFPLSGVNHALADPNIIPPNALERVEVLPDGSSAVYGSDAVAGVINFITRRKYEGMEASGQASFGDKYRAQQLGIIGGHTWDSGFVFGAYNYSHRGALAVSSRGFLDANNIDEARAAGLDVSTQTAQNRANLSTFFCDPASVTIGSTVYRFDPSNSTYDLSLPNVQSNAFCDVTQFNDLIPEETRNSFLVKGEQEVGDRLTLGVDVVYSNRKNFQNTSRASGGQTVQTTVFGPGSTPPAGSSINPFFVTIPGTTATSYTVRFSGDQLLGPGAYNKSGEETWYAEGRAEYRFSDSWRGSVAVVNGTSDSSSRDVGRLCTSCAQLALTGGPVSIPGGQTVTQALTTANALDVWGRGRTSPAVLAQLTDSTVTQQTRQGFKQFRAQANGDVVELPGGAMKLAAGAEYLDYTVSQDVTRPNGLGPATTNSRFLHLDYKRNVKAAFAELFIPVVNPDMHVPAVRSLDINLAGRHDKYSDFGSTTNPKVGVNWEVLEGVKLRGSWAKSFVAPALTSFGADGNGTTAETSVGAAGTINVPIALFPTVTGIPGAICSATTCTLGSGAARGLQINGGNSALGPQKGKTWSLGVDILPSVLRGFRFSATYWHNAIKGGITAPQAAFAVFGDPTRLQLFPTGLTATSPQLLSIIGGRPLNTTLSGTYYYTYSFIQGNVLNLTAEGIDADARYRYRAGWGSFDVGAAVSRKTKFDQSFGTGGTFSVLNTTGFNTTFPSIKLDVRADAGVNVGGFGARLYVNHTGGYKNWSNNAINPVVSDAQGLPTGGGDKVKAYTTIDMHLDYDVPGISYLKNTNIYFDVTNLFDKKPPFYNNANGGYDPFSGNPIGRVVSIGARVKI